MFAALCISATSSPSSFIILATLRLRWRTYSGIPSHGSLRWRVLVSKASRISIVRKFYNRGIDWETHKRLKMPTIVRLQSVFHVNNLRSCYATSLRHVVSVTTPKGDDEEFEVSHVFVVCMKWLPGRRGKYLFFMTHFNDDNTPLVWHRLNAVHRTTALQDFMETP
jgi:hypothetical protein